ncbi:MAG: methyl-accepting chemotaxis protein [Gallionella sp.]|jgi:methyl-accepting chemotaxis protein|nr:methyl-accepting chemotaxis protein [Gallionella sp.]MCK9353230.1 methyl-accepting chemotaxis protein [Gallionella sp.]
MLNLSLKTRLWLLALISATGIAVLAISSIWHAYQSKAVLLSFVDEKIALNRSATASYSHGLQMGQALRNILLDPANRKAYDNLAAASKSFSQETDKLVSMVAKTPGSTEITARLKRNIEQWLPLQNQILQMVNEQKNAEAMSLLVARETPAWRAVKDDLLGVVKTSEEGAASSRLELVAGFDSSRNFSIVLGLISFLMVTAITVFVARGIFKLIGGEPAYAATTLRRIADGDLTQQVTVRPGDNASIVAAMREMQSHIHQLIGNSVSSADSVVHESEGLQDDAARLSKSAEDQSAAVEAIAAAVEQLTVSISVMSENANEAGNLSTQSEKQASEGLKLVSATTGTIQNVAERMTEASATMEELAKKVGSVSGIVQTIRDIADQTNLLALNAAIEAARAGEQGRGFAVVADEVRKLAELTTKSTQEISRIVEGIGQTTDAAVNAMQRVKELALNGANQTEDVNKAVQLMDQSSLEVGKAVSYIVNALREQTAASNDIAKRIESIAQGIEQTHAASAESSRRSGVLVNLSHVLKESVRRFRV